MMKIHDYVTLLPVKEMTQVEKDKLKAMMQKLKEISSRYKINFVTAQGLDANGRHPSDPLYDRNTPEKGDSNHV